MDVIEDVVESEIDHGPRVGQVIRWHLTDAKRNTENREDRIEILQDMSDQYLSARFKSRRFADIDALEMQRAVDRAASLGAEKAAVWLQKLFSDMDKFAVREGLIVAVRAKRLQCPNIDRRPKALTDGAFRKTWKAYALCADGGSVVDRGPALAILVSGITLQPLGNVVRMRREDVNLKQRLWSSGDPRRHVHLSDVAVDLIGKAFALGDFIHRDTQTPFAFPSGGSKRDPFRVISYSGLFDISKRIIGREATPHDLRKTGIDALGKLGGKEMWSLTQEIGRGGTEQLPDTIHTALLDGWSTRIGELTKAAWR